MKHLKASTTILLGLIKARARNTIQFANDFLFCHSPIQLIDICTKNIIIYDMRKILVLLISLILCSSQANAFSFKKKPAVAIPAGSGYVGTLPNLEDRFKQNEIEETQPSFEYKDGFNDPNSIKPVPRDNPAFINIIMKKDKTSQYVNDLNDLISIIENLQTSIEEKDNIQKFNAQSYFLKENIDYFRDKYKDKAEESFISFKKVMQLNTHVQAVSQLRKESEVYSPYVTSAGSGNMFSQNNIDNQLDYLLDDIKKTLVVLKETR